MAPDKVDREKLRQILREEFESLRAKGRLDDDLLIESFVGEPTPNYYEVMCSILYKNN